MKFIVSGRCQSDIDFKELEVDSLEKFCDAILESKYGRFEILPPKGTEHDWPGNMNQSTTNFMLYFHNEYD